MSAAVAFLALQVAFDRREEIAADRFAVDLTRDLEAAAELMRFYENYVAKPLLAGGLARGCLGTHSRAGAASCRAWHLDRPGTGPPKASDRTGDRVEFSGAECRGAAAADG